MKMNLSQIGVIAGTTFLVTGSQLDNRFLSWFGFGLMLAVIGGEIMKKIKKK